MEGGGGKQRLRWCGGEESSGKQTETKAHSFLRSQVTTYNAKIDKQSANKARKTTINLKLAEVGAEWNFHSENQFGFPPPVLVSNEAIPTWCILIVSGTYL